MKRPFLLLFLIVFAGCAPHSISEYRSEGEYHVKKLIEELREVESVSQLENKQSKLKKRFISLVDLMISAKKFMLKHPDEGEEVTIDQFELSEALKREMVRIYNIEGCAELMEEIERDALHKLDLQVR